MSAETAGRASEVDPARFSDVADALDDHWSVERVSIKTDARATPISVRAIFTEDALGTIDVREALRDHQFVIGDAIDGEDQLVIFAEPVEGWL